jgi:hypothetical protein
MIPATRTKTPLDGPALTLKMKDEIVLDTASSASVFGNAEYVADIQAADGTLELQTNGGSIISKQKGNIDKFGKVWGYDKNSVTNIFSFAEMRKHYRITYVSTVRKMNKVAKILQDQAQNPGVDEPLQEEPLVEPHQTEFQDEEEEIVFKSEVEEAEAAQQEDTPAAEEEQQTNYKTRAGCLS